MKEYTFELNQDIEKPYLIIYGVYSNTNKNQLLATHHTIKHCESEQEAIKKFNQDNNNYGYYVIAIRQLADVNDSLKMNGGE